jgi:hypothetical protein
LESSRNLAWNTLVDYTLLALLVLQEEESDHWVVWNYDWWARGEDVLRWLMSLEKLA